MKSTFRFTFSNQLIILLEEFSQKYNKEERNVFKKEWNKWKEENATIIQEEINRIHNMGYTGNVLEKMFTSARYYYRKKKPQFEQPIITRKQYESIPKTILYHMDNHIREQIQQNRKPASSFENYITEINSLLKLHRIDNTDNIIISIKKKCKKSYKNRYQVESKKYNE
jgi:hypothetical protein